MVFQIMNIPLEYYLKIQIILIFTLTDLYNFIKYHLLQDIDYSQIENDNSIVLFDRSDNLLLGSFLVIFIQMNKKRDVITDFI